jgi:cation diffusion facilitator CzcD-associated flavoprotein CzcO
MEEGIGISRSPEKAKINTIIVGASAAGLACAAALTKKKIPFIVLEKSDQLAGPWRTHYDRLHLNTEKWRSHLPYLSFPKQAATYVPKDEVVKYLENYAASFGIQPLYQQPVECITRFNGGWKVKTSREEWNSDHVIIATGNNRRPVIPSWPGMDEFPGQLVHSSLYKNGAAFHGQKVLVVGFGSSACEIAICLHEYGAFPSMSVKGGVNVVPRSSGNEFTSKLLHRLSFLSRAFPAFVDRMNAAALNKKYGFLKERGVTMLPYGPNVQMMKYHQVPVLDIGTMELIKKGLIKILPGISSFNQKQVRFVNGEEKEFDAVILATGFRPHLEDFLPDAVQVTDASGRPLKSGEETALPGLFFCGFMVSPYGMLNQIGKEARRIAAEISRKVPRGLALNIW